MHSAKYSLLFLLHSAVLIGGRELPFESFSHSSRLDLFDLRKERWLKNYDIQTSLSRRIGHSVVSVRNRAYMFGGERLAIADDRDAFTYLDDLREFSFKDNVLRCEEMTSFEGDDPTTPSSWPSARAWHASVPIKHSSSFATEASKDDGLLIIGGKTTSGTLLSDVWMMLFTSNHESSAKQVDVTSASSRVRWIQIQPTGNSPLPLAYHSAVAVDEGNQVLVMGGIKRTVGPMLEGVYILDLTANAWSQLAISMPDGSKDLTVRCCSTAIPMVLPVDPSTGKILPFHDTGSPGEMEDKHNLYAKEMIFIFGGYNTHESATSTSAFYLLDHANASMKEVVAPNLGLKSYMGHAFVATADHKSLFFFGGVNPDTNEFLDLVSALHFWRPQTVGYDDGEGDPEQNNPIKTREFANGDVYVGELDTETQTVRHGNGKCTFHNGDIYDGGWRDDKQCGQGTMQYRNQDVYAGQWDNDQQHGFGIYEYHIEDEHPQLKAQQTRQPKKYEGRWEFGKKHGPGVLIFTDGTQLSGTWVEDQITATNVRLEHYDDGNGLCTYVGEIGIDGLPHGNGESHNATDTYVGNWVKGKRSGLGTSTLADGTVYRGDWKNGKRNGFGTCDYIRTREHYNGKWVGNVRCGHGVSTYANGCQYNGEWKDDQCHGTGRYTFADGTFYEGKWKQNEFYGDEELVITLQSMHESSSAHSNRSNK